MTYKTLTVSLLLAAGSTIADDSLSINALGWLQGCWQRSQDNRFAEECWGTAEGGLMLGYGKTVLTDGRVGFEYLRIEEHEQGLRYIAQPGGGEPTAFRLVAIDGQWAQFVNPDHDYPRVIEYRREDHELLATIGESDSVAESTNVNTFRFTLNHD